MVSLDGVIGCPPRRAVWRPLEWMKLVLNSLARSAVETRTYRSARLDFAMSEELHGSAIRHARTVVRSPRSRSSKSDPIQAKVAGQGGQLGRGDRLSTPSRCLAAAGVDEVGSQQSGAICGRDFWTYRSARLDFAMSEELHGSAIRHARTVVRSPRSRSSKSDRSRSTNCGSVAVPSDPLLKSGVIGGC